MKNVVFWAVDNYLSRLRYRNGYDTGPLKQRGFTVSMDDEEIGKECWTELDEDQSFRAARHSLLEEEKRARVEDMYETLSRRYTNGGKRSAMLFYERVPESLREALRNYAEYAAARSRHSISNNLTNEESDEA